MMVKQVLEYLNPQEGGMYIDATCGSGHHARAILEHTDGKAKIICIDKDPRAILRAKKYLEQFSDSVIFVNDGFENIEQIVKRINAERISGILFDLGFSSEQISDSEAGFGFRQDGMLDMRFNPESPVSAYDVVNSYPEYEIKRILFEYGEMKDAEKIAHLICEERKKRTIRTTRQLADLIASCRKKRGNIHPATQVFQAIRIYVNNELENLKSGLNGALKVLMPGGRIVVISYHSLEDRIVKKFMKSSNKLRMLFKKVIVPDHMEKVINPCARSAKMRVAEVIN